MIGCSADAARGYDRPRLRQEAGAYMRLVTVSDGIRLCEGFTGQMGMHLEEEGAIFHSSRRALSLLFLSYAMVPEHSR